MAKDKKIIGADGGNYLSNGRLLKIKVEDVTKRVALRAFHIGCEPKNYSILENLPLTAKGLEAKFKLSPMPTHRRIQQLMNAGLVKREKRGDMIRISDFGIAFKNAIEQIRKDVIKELPFILP